MRRSTAVLLVFVALPLAAAEWKSPDWYLQQLRDRIRSGNRWTLGIPKRHPDSAKLLREGEELYGRKQYAEAAVRYRKMIELDANDAAAHLLYGDVFFFGHRDYAAAVAEYRKALAIDASQRCPIAAPMYPEPLHQEVEKYVARYVVVKK
jgi:tetratricopeptide (TPR) repeat protein